MKFADLNIPTVDEIKRIEIIKNIYGNKLVTAKDIFDVLSPADAFFLSSFMNSQGKSTAIENYLIKKLHGIKVNASIERGDCLANNIYYELKTSTSNKSHALNIRQIRNWHNLDYYICTYIDDKNIENSKCYILTKEEMNEEIKLMGSFTHGTKNSNMNNVNQEYSITIYPYSVTNTNTQRWDKKYLDDKLYQKFFK